MGNKKDVTGNSLIPIKGISQAQKKALNTTCQIYDISGLLVRGRTPDQREQLAKTLGLDKKHVNLWVKQADLWRVPGMTEDFAYLLVLTGIRGANDLSKINTSKTKDFLRAVSNTHPGFTWDESQLEDLVKNAGLLESAAASGIGLSLDVSDETAPTYLFADDESDKIHNPKSESELISEGLAFLRDITVALPLPRVIGGVVKMREDTNAAVVMEDVQVELEGIVNPSVESSEGSNLLCTYTDGYGRFSITMPDKYSMQDNVTFVFSYKSYKQRIIKQASEIIENTVIRNGGKDENGKPLTAQALIKKFDELDSTNKTIRQRELELELLEKIEFLEEQKKSQTDSDEETKLSEDITKYTNIKSEAGIVDSKDKIEDQIAAKKAQRTKLLKEIYGLDPTTNDLEKNLTNLMSRTDLESCFDGDEDDENCKNKCFMLVERIFKGYKEDKPRALPSVKLMGEGNQATWLPTDRAPSRTYNYTMLQRLVEPSISPAVGAILENGRSQRKKMTSPLDVSDFKRKLYENPDSIPKMSSLGMGYVLNMHQAWVPDGFALGTLLYSLILAPGEEQRLIVRENNQSYHITDSAEGSDSTSESHSRSQTDDIQAIYDYLLNQDSQGSSNSKYSTSGWSIGGSLSGYYSGVSLGLTGGYSKSSGSASASARQTNNHSEASQAAQSFNQRFATASNLLAKAKRVSISTASSNAKESVATKIIANHNHSHAMTIQYWEVVRRYRLETSIDGVDLLLFIPLNTVRFLPMGELFHCTYSAGFSKDRLVQRYGTILRYYDLLINAVPYKYRTGLNLIQRYASMPAWTMEDISANERTVTLTFKSNLLPFDNLSARMKLKNGKGTISASMSYTAKELPDKQLESTVQLKQHIRKVRNEKGTVNVTCTFALPANVLDEDISSIELKHSCDDLSFTLYQKQYGTVYDEDGEAISLQEAYKEYWKTIYWAAEDDKKTKFDLQRNEFWKSQLPEAYYAPVVQLKASELNALGEPTITDIKISGAELSAAASGSVLTPSVFINISSKLSTLRYTEFQKMEAALQHIASETLRYSQLIWQSLSSNELAMMLEQYSIDMNFKTYFDTDGSDTQIPLLNCVNVSKVVGYYGNCVLLPFTFPEELSRKIGKTAAEIQDALYRYHTSCFRAPSTTVSIPTDGMIGEAVLGATNVSEEIDLTRFWNWKDSPIDSMTLDSSYINGNDYLANKTTKDISALNLQTAAATAPVTTADLISALVSKQTPTFDNITGLDQITDILKNATNTTAQGRDNAINQSSTLANKAMDYAIEKMKTASQERLAKINAGNKSTEGTGSGGGSGNSSGSGDDTDTDEDVEGGSFDSDDEIETDDEDIGDGFDSDDDTDGDSTEENPKSDLLNTVLESAIQAIQSGKSPEEFFANITNSSADSTEIQNIADNFCSEMGSDLDSVLDAILT
jgi:hypothetical protein